MMDAGVSAPFIQSMPEGDPTMIRCLRPSLHLPLLLIIAGRALAAPTVAGNVPISPEPLTVAVEAGTHRVFVADGVLGAVGRVYDSRGAVGGTIHGHREPSWPAGAQHAPAL